MKAGDKERKDSLSMLLSALKNKAIDKREDLTEAEENEVKPKRGRKPAVKKEEGMIEEKVEEEKEEKVEEEVKQILLQRGIELVVLEIAMCFAIRFVMGESFPQIGYVAILISTAFFDVLSYLIKWYLEKEEADKI